jgi:hypothetical protein
VASTQRCGVAAVAAIAVEELVLIPSPTDSTLATVKDGTSRLIIKELTNTAIVSRHLCSTLHTMLRHGLSLSDAALSAEEADHLCDVVSIDLVIRNGVVMTEATGMEGIRRTTRSVNEALTLVVTAAEDERRGGRRVRQERGRDDMESAKSGWLG